MSWNSLRWCIDQSRYAHDVAIRRSRCALIGCALFGVPFFLWLLRRRSTDAPVNAA